MTLFVLALQACCAFIALAAGVVTLLSKNLKPVNFWLSMTSIFAGLWVVGIAVFILQTDTFIAEIIARGYYAAALTIGISLYFFSRFYPRKKASDHSEQIAFLLLYALGVIYSLIPGWLVQEVVTAGRTQLGYQSNIVDLNGFLYGYYVVVFLCLVLRALGNLRHSYAYARGRSQLQLAREIRGIIVYVTIALVGGMVFNLFLPLLGNYRLIWIGPLFTACFTIYLFYVVSKQGILDIRAAVARSVGYVVMVSAIAVVYGAVLFTVSGPFMGNAHLTLGQLFFFVVLAVILTFTVRPLQKILDRLTYDVFYHSDYELEEMMQEFSAMTANEIELGRLVRRSLGVLSRALRPEYVSLFVLSSNGKTYHYAKNMMKGGTPRRYQHQLDVIKDMLGELPRLVRVNDAQTVELHEAINATGAAVVAQLIVRDEHVGVLFLGRRQSGSAYSEKDMQMLSTASDELALAIQNGLRFEEISQFNKRLRTEIDQATKELRRSNRQLHQIDEVKDEFLSIASHQLRTPLTSIKGYISMVLDGDVGKITPQQRHLLEEAFNSSQRMVSLIEDFLNMSRLQTGRFIIDKEDTDVYELVKNEVDNLRSTAKSHDLALRFDAKNEFPIMNIDDGKIRQVIMNFIDNAIYYSKPDTTIRIAMHKKAGQLMFEVHDTGIGVPIQEQARLFSKFYRASNARRRRPDGTGVGLYLAKKVITAHGGSIIFHSTENKGSTFGFKLPLS